MYHNRNQSEKGFQTNYDSQLREPVRGSHGDTVKAKVTVRGIGASSTLEVLIQL